MLDTEFSKIQEIVERYLTDPEFRKKKFHSNYSDIFRLAYPELLPYILENTGFLDGKNPKMRTRIACLLGNVRKIPKCVECGKDVDISDIRPGKPVPKFCSHTCMLKSPVTFNARKQNKLKKYGDENWNNSEKRKRTIAKKLEAEPDYYGRIDEKRKKTKLERYGDENWTNAEKSAETRNLIYGRRGWSEKMRNAQLGIPLEKRKATAKARGEALKRKYAENPHLKNEVQEKSKKTRIEQHGEDYSGRGKCQNTMLERYGVRNAFQLETSK